MRKGLILSLITLCTILGQTTITNASILSETTKVTQQQNEFNYTSNDEFLFEDVDQETIDKMKANLEIEKKYDESNYSFDVKESKASLSSLMAKAFDVVGFNNTALALDYSMKPFRPEPLVHDFTSPIANDIWNYSTDFESAMKSFLTSARNSGKHEYFKTTSMIFKMPNASKPSIMANKGLKKRTDLFGTLNKVRVNFGVVKNNFGKWHVMALIEDRYDFAKEDYNSLVNIVNNIAYYEQELGKVNPYDIQIYADKPHLVSPPFGIAPW